MRRYDAYIVAETTVNATAGEAGNQGFRILAGYIFGQNIWARYDPPWKPWFLRRNEVLLELD